MRLLILLLFASLSSLLMAQQSTEPSFQHDVETEKKPWTHLQFHNDPDHFQFAIVTDNTGGMRKGVFESAVVKLNLMQPEFVMSVGDLIEGYTDDQAQINKEWDEFNGWANQLEMPFFYLPGNHDISNVTMQKDWEERYGVRYYSFVYKDVLFITMDTDDGDQPAWYQVSKEQERWVMDQLEAHPEVRWTFFFMHHPLWNEEVNALTNIEAKLKKEGRSYTMFAGHKHRYMHNVRQGKDYYVLATTGGGSSLRGPSFGEFDHVTWVTVTDDGPKMANLWLDGIIDMDVYNPEVDKLASSLKEAAALQHLVFTRPDAEDFTGGMLMLQIRNTSNELLHFNGKFFHHHQVNILMPEMNLELEPGSTQQIPIELNAYEQISYNKLDYLQLQWTASYDSSAYPDLKLGGTYQVTLKPGQPQLISPDRSVFIKSMTVSPASPWNNLILRYTTDGTAPTSNSPQWKEAITLKGGTTTLKAQLFHPKGYVTAVDKRVFKEVKPRKGDKVKNPKAGLKYSYYEGNWKMLPDFSQLQPLETGVASDLDVEEVAPADDHYGLVFEGYLKVPETGMYTLYTYSDDGTFLFIDGEKIVDNDGSHSSQLRKGYVALKKGYHPITIHYFEDHGGETLRIGYQLPGMEELEEIPVDWLVHE